MKLSILCTTYNHGQFIAHAIEAFVMQQTDFTYEIIIGDDCSTDDTAAICKRYQQKYPGKITLLENENNIGMMPNFIKTYDACSGKYIALCEGDDYWTDPLKLQKQVDFLETNPDYTICFHRVYQKNNNGEIKLSRLNTFNEEKTFSIEDLAVSNFIHTPSVVYRNNLFANFPVWLNTSPVGDYVLHMLNARHGLIKYLPDAMAVYRIHDGGIWSGLQLQARIEKWLQVLGNLIHEDFSPEIISLLKEQQLRSKETVLKALMNDASWQEFLKTLAKYSENDNAISRKWLLESYPAYIESIKLNHQKALEKYTLSGFSARIWNRLKRKISRTKISGKTGQG